MNTNDKKAWLMKHGYMGVTIMFPAIGKRYAKPWQSHTGLQYTGHGNTMPEIYEDIYDGVKDILFCKCENHDNFS